MQAEGRLAHHKGSLCCMQKADRSHQKGSLYICEGLSLICTPSHGPAAQRHQVVAQRYGLTHVAAPSDGLHLERTHCAVFTWQHSM